MSVSKALLWKAYIACNALSKRLPDTPEIIQSLSTSLSNNDISQYLFILQFLGKDEKAFAADVYPQLELDSVIQILLNLPRGIDFTVLIENTVFINHLIVIGKLLYKTSGCLEALIWSILTHLNKTARGEKSNDKELKLIAELLYDVFKAKFSIEDAQRILSNGEPLLVCLFCSCISAIESENRSDLQRNLHPTMLFSFLNHLWMRERCDEIPQLRLQLIVLAFETVIRNCLKKFREIVESSAEQDVELASKRQPQGRQHTEIKEQSAVAEQCMYLMFPLLSTAGLAASRIFLQFYHFLRNLKILRPSFTVSLSELEGKMKKMSEEKSSIRSKQVVDAYSKALNKEAITILVQILANPNLLYEEYSEYLRIHQFPSEPSEEQPSVQRIESIIQFLSTSTNSEHLVMVLLQSSGIHNSNIVKQYFLGVYCNPPINTLSRIFNKLLATLLNNTQNISYGQNLPQTLLIVAFGWIKLILDNQIHIDIPNLNRMVELLNLLKRFKQNGYLCYYCCIGQDFYVCKKCNRICNVVKKLKTSPELVPNYYPIKQTISDIKKQLKKGEVLLEKYLVLTLLQ